MVFGVIYVQFSTILFSRKFWFSDRSYFWGHFFHSVLTLLDFSTPHPGPKAILGHCAVGGSARGAWRTWSALSTVASTAKNNKMTMTWQYWYGLTFIIKMHCNILVFIACITVGRRDVLVVEPDVQSRLQPQKALTCTWLAPSVRRGWSVRRRRGSSRKECQEEWLRRTRQCAQVQPMDRIVVVGDNAPVHNCIETVAAEFEGSRFLEWPL